MERTYHGLLGKVIADYPAFSIHEIPTRVVMGTNISLPVLRAGDTVAFPFVSKFGRSKGETQWRFFGVNSVISYALAYDNCPLEAYKKAIERGHKTHFMFGHAVVVSNMKQAKGQRASLQFGQPFLFEGHIFVGKIAPNENVDMVEITPEEAKAILDEKEAS